MPPFTFDPSAVSTHSLAGDYDTQPFPYGGYSTASWMGKLLRNQVDANLVDPQHPLCWNRETWTVFGGYTPTTVPANPVDPSVHPTWRNPSKYFSKINTLVTEPRAVLLDWELVNNWINLPNVYTALATDLDKNGIFIGSIFDLVIGNNSTSFVGFTGQTSLYITMGLPVISFTDINVTIPVEGTFTDPTYSETTQTATWSYRTGDTTSYHGGEVLIFADDNFYADIGQGLVLFGNPYLSYLFDPDPTPVWGPVHRQDALIAAEMAYMADAIPRFNKIRWRTFTFADNWAGQDDGRNGDLNTYILSQLPAGADWDFLSSDYSSSDLENQIVSEIQSFFSL